MDAALTPRAEFTASGSYSTQMPLPMVQNWQLTISPFATGRVVWATLQPVVPALQVLSLMLCSGDVGSY